MAQETSSSLKKRKKLLKIDWKEYLKKDGLFFRGFYIYILFL